MTILGNVSLSGVTIRTAAPPPTEFISQDPSFSAPYAFFEPFNGAGDLIGKSPPIGVTPGTTGP